jgi:hypothetical protein
MQCVVQANPGPYLALVNDAGKSPRFGGYQGRAREKEGHVDKGKDKEAGCDDEKHERHEKPGDPLGRPAPRSIEMHQPVVILESGAGTRIPEMQPAAFGSCKHVRDLLLPCPAPRMPQAMKYPYVLVINYLKYFHGKGPPSPFLQKGAFRSDAHGNFAMCAENREMTESSSDLMCHHSSELDE